MLEDKRSGRSYNTTPLAITGAPRLQTHVTRATTPIPDALTQLVQPLSPQPNVPDYIAFFYRPLEWCVNEAETMMRMMTLMMMRMIPQEVPLAFRLQSCRDIRLTVRRYGGATEHVPASAPRTE